LYPDLRRYGLKLLLAIAPRILVLAPLAEEWSSLVRASEERHRPETVLDLKLPCRYVPVWQMGWRRAVMEKRNVPCKRNT